MISCKEKLDSCKAMCCKLILFAINKKQLSKESIKHYNRHRGIKAIDKGNYVRLIIYAPCKYLSELNTCLIHNKDKPEMCRNAYQKVKNTSVTFMPKCIYKPSKKSIILTKEELEYFYKLDKLLSGNEKNTYEISNSKSTDRVEQDKGI